MAETSTYESNIRTLIGLIKNKFSNYTTTSDTQTAINNAISSVTTLSFKKVDSLPSTGEDGFIYLVPNSGSGSNAYDEYFWDNTNSHFELFGTTEVDLSGYVQINNLNTTLSDYVQTSTLTTTLNNYTPKTSLDNYVKKTDLVTITDAQIETMWTEIMG